MSKRKSPAEQAAFHLAEMQRHARRAWIESHPEIKEALAIAAKCDRLADNVEAFEDLGTQLAVAAGAIRMACDVTIDGEMAASKGDFAVSPAPGKAEEKQL